MIQNGPRKPNNIKKCTHFIFNLMLFLINTINNYQTLEYNRFEVKFVHPFNNRLFQPNKVLVDFEAAILQPASTYFPCCEYISRTGFLC